MEPSCSANANKIIVQSQPHRLMSRLSTPSQRAKIAKLHLEQLAEDLFLIGERMSVWALLPINLLVTIFKLLSVYDQARCASVCKKWNAAYHMPDLWHEFVFEFTQKTTSRSTPRILIKQVFEKHSNDVRYVMIKVDGYQQSVEAACSVLSQLVHCTIHTLQLSSITGPGFRTQQPHKFVTALKGIFTNSHLKSLTIEETPIDDALLEILSKKSQATLACLRLCSCPMVSAAGIARVVDKCLRMYDLAMDYTHMSEALLHALCNSTHREMKRLSVNVTEHDDQQMDKQTLPWQSISSKTWDLLAHHFPEITFCLQFSSIKEEYYQSFFCSAMPLTSLRFGCLVPKVILSHVATQCTRLKELYIANSGNEPINQEILEIAKKCPHLKVLELSNCLINCSTVVQLAKLCGPRLTRLVIHEEASLENRDCDIETMTSQVSYFLQRTWDVEFIPTWFE